MASRNRKVLPRRTRQKVSKIKTVPGHHTLPRKPVLSALAGVDIITAGVPCQDVSVAGKRAGLKGVRTGLFYEFARILRELRPRWFVFENVPGLFSSNQGRDFAEVLRVLMVECGYGVQWRVLDSRDWGVAQRRRRLFIVGYFGAPCPPEILFESPRRNGHSAKGREAWESSPHALGNSVANPLRCQDGHGSGNQLGYGNDNIVHQAISSKWAKGSSGPAGHEHHNLIVAHSLRESDGHHGRSSPRGDRCDNIIAAPLSAGSFDASHSPGRRREDDFNLVAASINHLDHQHGTDEAANGLLVIANVKEGRQQENANGKQWQFGGPCPTLDAIGQHAVAFESRFARNGRGAPSAIVPPLKAQSGQSGKGDSAPLVAALFSTDGGYSVAKACAGNYVGSEINSDRMRSFAGLPKGLDSARYRALGNAVTVQVAEWIAKRIKNYELKMAKVRNS